MYTDMVGYTALGQRNESLSIALVEEQRKVIRPILSRHNGREVKTMGDAFLVEFPSALDAVRCAYDIQRATREFNIPEPEDRRIHLRVGIHLGDVVESQGDISGDAVNVASRIEPLAEDGGVCLSRQVYDHVQNKFELSLSSLGVKELKNVSSPLEVYKMAMPWSEGGRTGLEAKLDRSRVAILPFRNMSPDPSDEYFTEGMTEELITTLSKVGQLTVIARTSVMQYKNTTKRISDISRELSAGTLIEGSVRKAGNRVRITVQLIDSKTEGHVWAQNYDKQLDDIFAIQSEIAERVANELRIQLVESEKQRIERSPTTSTEAYILYLKGRHYWNERSEDGVRKAIEYFSQAIKIDPNFALGYSGLADCYQIMGHNAIAEFGPSYEKAREYAEKALELEGNLAEAHAALAGVKADYEHDWKSAEAEYKRAIELKPSYSSAHQWYGIFLGTQRRLEEAEREVRKAYELDPLSLVINVNIGDGFYYHREYDKAIEQYRKVLEMDPEFASAYYSSIQSYVSKGSYKEALEAGENFARLTRRPSWGKQLRAFVFASMGEADEARRLLKDAESGYQSEHLSPYGIALTYFRMGDSDTGFVWLQRAYDEHDSSLLNLAIDFELDAVREDQRYLSMLDKLGFGQLPPSN